MPWSPSCLDESALLLVTDGLAPTLDIKRLPHASFPSLLLPAASRTSSDTTNTVVSVMPRKDANVREEGARSLGGDSGFGRTRAISLP